MRKQPLSADSPHPADHPSVSLYLDLLKRCLCRDLVPDSRYEGDENALRSLPFDAALREDGRDWPTEAETLVGKKRLDNLARCCLTVLREEIRGDFVETGVWRGGCGILMRGVLAATGDSHRTVWLFDSFQGLPKPDPASFPRDEGDSFWKFREYLGVSLEQVQENFRRYHLLDARTRFVPGWFRDTIPAATLDAISVLRLDGDMYESTWLALEHLYPRVSTGGFVIIDDFGAVPACRTAVEDFRSRHGIASPITPIDWTGVFWRK